MCAKTLYLYKNTRRDFFRSIRFFCACFGRRFFLYIRYRQKSPRENRHAKTFAKTRTKTYILLRNRCVRFIRNLHIRDGIQALLAKRRYRRNNLHKGANK